MFTIRSTKSFVLKALAVVLALEVAFRLLPVSTGYYLDDITAEQPIARRVSDIDATLSQGWLMADAVSRRINNAGFVNATDYIEGSDKPVIALIGDSQIEAPQVQEEETIHQLLRSEAAGQVEFYTFAMSGAPLSQYAVWARHAVETYEPRLLVFFVSPNDFDESFDRHGMFPGFHYLREGEDEPSVSLREYHRGWGSHLAQHSALVAYLIHNLELPSAFAGSSDGSTSRLAPGEKDQLLTWFFDELADVGVDSRNAIFVANPFDNSHYDADCGVPINRHNPYDEFRTVANAYGYSVLWPNSAFCEVNRETGERLEGTDGIHWNARGHEAMARFLGAALPLDELLTR